MAIDWTRLPDLLAALVWLAITFATLWLIASLLERGRGRDWEPRIGEITVSHPDPRYSLMNDPIPEDDDEDENPPAPDRPDIPMAPGAIVHLPSVGFLNRSRLEARRLLSGAVREADIYESLGLTVSGCSPRVSAYPTPIILEEEILQCQYCATPYEPGGKGWTTTCPKCGAPRRRHK